MPYLRFARDPRGYESTSVLHTFRRSGRSRSRILYWFRTPPNVKIGRAPLDEVAIREIEKHHPDLEFDWTKILETQPAPAPAQSRRPERRGRRSTRPGEDRRGGRAAQAAPAPPATTSGETLGEPSSDISIPIVDVTAAPPETHFPDAASEGDTGESSMDMVEPPANTTFDVEPSGENASENEAAIEAEAAAAIEDWEADDRRESSSHVSAVEELMGAEGLARLRARYAEIQARITERGGDPAELAELRRRAEALDPDTWVTKDEARQALEHYEARLEEFRRVLPPRRRRSRRGGRRRRGRNNQATAPAASPGTPSLPEEGDEGDENA